MSMIIYLELFKKYFKLFYFCFLKKTGIKKIVRTTEYSKNYYNKAVAIEQREKKWLMYNGKKLVFDYAIDIFEGDNNIIKEEIEKFGNVKTVLDVGCGTGRRIPYLKKKLSNISFQGVDVSKTRIERGKKKFNNIKLFVSPADKLPFKDNSIDIIYTHHSLEQMPYTIEKVIKEFNRVCKKGIIIFEPFYELQNKAGKMHNYVNDYVRNIPKHVVSNGFQITKFVNLNRGSYSNQSGLLIGKKVKK